MKIKLTIVFLLFCICANSQMKKESFVAVVNNDICWLTKNTNCILSPDTLIPQGTFVTISNYTCNGHYIEILLNKEKYVAFKDNFNADVRIFDILKHMNKDSIEHYSKIITANSILADSLNKLKFIQDSIDKKLERLEAKLLLLKAQQQGIIITDLKLFDESEVTSGTGYKIEFINLSKKTIKYINFTFAGYNAVNDIVFDPITRKSTTSLKGIGPIESYSFATYEKNYAWFTDIVQTIKIKSISIQYMDGTTKQVINPNNYIIDQNQYDELFPDK